ncbi:N-acetyltransferase [Bacillus sp. NEB1478]|uniref:GNAT family N-acetyltransferase n=1 Tax=Bacillus sp. NEB1478 TaxID=3073816 RepID=UPI002873F139|nr:N-acetyltransferase [Bacillus sp. NEB1478]WNB90954.1 N-acetyltransferase [Bacillus sp. NEB1478]
MKIRCVKKEEHRFTEDFVYEVFKNSTNSDGIIQRDLVKEIREKPFYIPELDLVVEDEGVIIGHFILSRFPISNKHENEVLMLTPVSVDIQKQGQGIGKFMLREGIKRAAKMGYKGIIVEGDFRYYRQFGFRTSTFFGIQASKKNLPPAEEYLMAMELCVQGLAEISGEVDYSMYKVLTHG